MEQVFCGSIDWSVDPSSWKLFWSTSAALCLVDAQRDRVPTAAAVWLNRRPPVVITVLGRRQSIWSSFTRRCPSVSHRTRGLGRRATSFKTNRRRYARQLRRRLINLQGRSQASSDIIIIIICSMPPVAGASRSARGNACMAGRSRALRSRCDHNPRFLSFTQ